MINTLINPKIVFIGPSGCGKGTQAKILSGILQISSVSSGDLLRSAYEEKSADGLEAAQFWMKGDWVEDHLVSKIVFEKLSTIVPLGFILDAYPRTYNQAVYLKDYLYSKNCEINYALYFKLSKQRKRNEKASCQII